MLAKNKNSISGQISEELFNKLDYQRLLIGLENEYKPYKLLNKDLISFKYTGTAEEINLLSKKWQEIEDEDNAKYIQLEYSFSDEKICKLGNYLNFGFLPIAKITNKGKDKIFILLKNGTVITNLLDKKEKNKLEDFNEDFKIQMKIALEKVSKS